MLQVGKLVTLVPTILAHEGNGDSIVTESGIIIFIIPFDEIGS
jgi:hypothetical protein